MFGKGGYGIDSYASMLRINENEWDSHEENKYSVGAFEITNFIPLQFT